MVWYSHLFQNCPQFIVIHTVKGFSIVNKAEIDVFLELSCFFWNSLAFSMIQQMLAIWFLVPLPFLGSFVQIFQLEHLEIHSLRIAEAWLGEFWALLYWCVRWVQFCSSLSILWHCLSLVLGWKLTFSSPVVTVEFSKFAGILSAASSFKIWNSSAGIPSLPLALFVCNDAS